MKKSPHKPEPPIPTHIPTPITDQLPDPGTPGDPLDPIIPPAPLKFAIKPNENIGFKIIHEDADLLIVEKPYNLVTQPGKGHTTDSLLNGLFATHGKWLQNLGVRRDFGLLHRLDKDTSGLLVIALKPNAYDQLRRDFEERKIEKEYLTITAGAPNPPQGVCQARLKETEIPNADGHGSIKKSVISRQGQEAISAYKTLKATSDAALVSVNLKTGRLHQIRAHMLFLNTPVMGDDLYKLAAPRARPTGDTPRPRAPRLCLHAHHLGFKHPTTNKWLNTTSPLPSDLAHFARKLGLLE